jgi:hypothetical protein
LPTRLVSLNGPDESSHVALPEKEEPLQLGDIGQLTNNPRIQIALRRLAAEKAPETVSQLVLWRLSAGLDWATIGRLSQKWANPQELALAKQFVTSLDAKGQADQVTDSGRLYWEVTVADTALEPVAAELRVLFDNNGMLGLKVEKNVPARPDGPSLACRVRLSGSGDKTEAIVTLSATDGSGSAWTPMGKFTLPLVKGKAGQLKAEEIADATAEGILGRLVRAQLTKGPKVKGKETFKVRIDNASPLILNGLALSGTSVTTDKEAKSAALSGLSLPPRRSLTISATGEVVERLGMKTGIKAVAADLSGL